MAWIGWVIAIVAIGVAVWLKRQLAAERAHAGELLYAKIEAEDALEARQGGADAGPAPSPLGTIAERLDPPLQSAGAHLADAAAQLAEYRERVNQFDAAVQYCLQPVELIFGADKANLDELVGHVEGARRKLFEARTAVERHPLHQGTDLLAAANDDLRDLGEYALALRAEAAGVQAGESGPEAEPSLAEKLPESSATS
jgi:hypothetical protein